MNALEYNTERSKLIIPEYGRHIHQMVDQAVALKDKEERNNMAKAIIGVMGNLNPHLRDVPDFHGRLVKTLKKQLLQWQYLRLFLLLLLLVLIMFFNQG